MDGTALFLLLLELALVVAMAILSASACVILA